MGYLRNFGNASALSLGVLAIASSAYAIPYGTNTVYKTGTDVIISATAGSQVSVGLGSTVKSKAALVGSCGEVKVSLGTTLTPPATLTVGTKTITIANLPTQLLPKCVNGQFEEARTADFKTSTGQIVVVGLTPSQSVTVGIPTATTRKVTINGCGFGTLKNATGTLAINGQNYTVSSLPDAGAAPTCRNTNGVSTGYVPAAWP
jgi:hypothetical protein